MKCLFIPRRPLGDVVASLPAIHAISEELPSATIHVIVSKGVAALLQQDPKIHKVISVEYDLHAIDLAKTDVRAIRSNLEPSYDLICDWIASQTTLALLQTIPARIIVGLAQPFNTGLLTHSMPDESWRSVFIQNRKATEYFADHLRLIWPNLSIRRPQIKLAHNHTNNRYRQRQNTRVGIFPGAGFPDKRWDYCNFIELSERLESKGLNVVHLFGPQEVDLLEKFKLSGTFERRNYFDASDGDLLAMMGLLRELRFLVTNDTGIMHVAGALGVKTCGIFATKTAASWFFYQDNGIAIEPREPSLVDVEKYFNGITPETIWTQIADW